MSETFLNVKLIGKPENALAVIYAACRQCYSPMFAGNMYEDALSSKEPEKIGEFVRKVISSGHESPVEHVKFTFAIEGVSRALTHQLVRHRIASYSQQSQRYVTGAEFSYIVPPSFKKDEDILSRFVSTMEEIQKSYNELSSLLKKNGIDGEKANQDARFVLPQAAETKIVVTMNCRELIHFFRERCCTRAQWEIRALAERMLQLVRHELPEVFASVGAKCEELNYCPEGPKFSCGKFPSKESYKR